MEDESASAEDRELERRLHDALAHRAERTAYSPYAYRSVLRTADRRRRRRHRRRMIAGSAVAVSALAIPIGMRLVDREGPTEVRSPEIAGADVEGLPDGVVPADAPENTIVDLTAPAIGTADYVQVFRTLGRDGRLVARQSSLSPDRLVEPEDSTEVDINGARAWLVRQDSRRASLTWADEQSLVVRQLHARSLSDAELLDVARTLQRRPSGLGFDTVSLPEGLEVVSEGGLDEPAEPTEVRFEVGGEAINVAFRDGSILELELLRATASEVLVMNIGDVERVLVTESIGRGIDDRRHTMSWMLRPGVIVDVSGDRVARNELVSFVTERDWLSIYDAAGDAAVVVRPEEPSNQDGPAAERAEIGVAVEGTVLNTRWRVSVNDVGTRCVVLKVGATEAEECLRGGVEVVTFDVGTRTALVVVGDGSPVTVVEMDGVSWMADGRAGDLWVSWLPEGSVNSPVTVTVADDTGGTVTTEVPLGSTEVSSGSAS